MYKIVLLTFLYIVAFLYSYSEYTVYYFKYLGFRFDERFIILSSLFAIIPIFFYRDRTTFSSFYSIVIYLLGYIPICLIYLSIVGVSPRSLLILSVLCITMIAFFYISKFSYKKKLTLALTISNRAIKIFFGLLVSWIVVEFGGSLTIRGLGDIYEQRAIGKQVYSSSFVGYAVLIVTYVLTPILVAKSTKTYHAFLITTGVALLGYSAVGSKASIILPFVLLCLYILWKKGRLSSFPIIFYNGLLGLILVLVIFLHNPWFFHVNAIVFARTLATEGLLFSRYDLFFQNHDYIWFSHVNVIDFLFNAYPYDQPLGYVVSSYFLDRENNSNAIFWAMDGLSSGGTLGILLISIVVATVLYFIDLATNNHSTLYKVLGAVSIAFFSLNVSFFTTLLSGGLWLLFFLSITNRKGLFNDVNYKT